MPRPKKQVEAINIPLDVASVKMSKVMEFYGPTTLLRIKQAIARHPDLDQLLEPVEKELIEQKQNLLVAKAALSTAKSLVRKAFSPLKGTGG